MKIIIKRPQSPSPEHARALLRALAQKPRKEGKAA